MCTSSKKLLTFGWALIERSLEHVHPLLMCFPVLLPERSSAGVHQVEGKGQIFSSGKMHNNMPNAHDGYTPTAVAPPYTIFPNRYYVVIAP
jgi:hypothetical protein